MIFKATNTFKFSLAALFAGIVIFCAFLFPTIRVFAYAVDPADNPNCVPGTISTNNMGSTCLSIGGGGLRLVNLCAGNETSGPCAPARVDSTAAETAAKTQGSNCHAQRVNFPGVDPNTGLSYYYYTDCGSSSGGNEETSNVGRSGGSGVTSAGGKISVAGPLTSPRSLKSADAATQTGATPSASVSSRTTSGGAGFYGGSITIPPAISADSGTSDGGGTIGNLGEVDPLATPTFKLAVTPADRTVAPGTTAVYTIKAINTGSNPALWINLGVGGFPSGASPHLSSLRIQPGQTVELRIAVPATASDDYFPITVSGVGAKAKVDAEVGLIIAKTGTEGAITTASDLVSQEGNGGGSGGASIKTPTNAEPVTGSKFRYLRIETWEPGWVAFRDIEAYDANGKKITPVKAEASHTSGDSFAQKAIDGNLETSWNSGESDYVCAGTGFWFAANYGFWASRCSTGHIVNARITVDLGEIKNVSKVRFLDEGYTTNERNELSVSNDGTNFTKIATYVNDTSTPDYVKWQEYPQTAQRYATDPPSLIVLPSYGFVTSTKQFTSWHDPGGAWQNRKWADVTASTAWSAEGGNAVFSTSTPGLLTYSGGVSQPITVTASYGGVSGRAAINQGPVVGIYGSASQARTVTLGSSNVSLLKFSLQAPLAESMDLSGVQVNLNSSTSSPQFSGLMLTLDDAAHTPVGAFAPLVLPPATTTRGLPYMALATLQNPFRLYAGTLTRFDIRGRVRSYESNPKLNRTGAILSLDSAAIRGIGSVSQAPVKQEGALIGDILVVRGFPSATTTPVLPPKGSTAPYASLTAGNNARDITVNVGDAVTYKWTSRNGSFARSYYETPDGADKCLETDRNPMRPWRISTLSGTLNIKIRPCQEGTTYRITYEVQNSKGESADDVLVVHVRNALVPVAQFFANNETQEVYANPGTAVNYEWDSAGAVSAQSSIRAVNGKDICPAGTASAAPVFGTGGSSDVVSWIANTLRGTQAVTVDTCQAGVTYKITYRVASASGTSAEKQVLLRVAGEVQVPVSTSTPATQGYFTVFSYGTATTTPGGTIVKNIDFQSRDGFAGAVTFSIDVARTFTGNFTSSTADIFFAKNGQSSGSSATIALSRDGSDFTTLAAVMKSTAFSGVFTVWVNAASPGQTVQSIPVVMRVQ